MGHTTIKYGLYEHHAIDPVSFEVAQPGRLTEILDEMERRGMVETIAIKGQTFWKKK